MCVCVRACACVRARACVCLGHFACSSVRIISAFDYHTQFFESIHRASAGFRPCSVPVSTHWCRQILSFPVHGSLKPALNKDRGRHQLAHIWDRLLALLISPVSDVASSGTLSLLKKSIADDRKLQVILSVVKSRNIKYHTFKIPQQIACSWYRWIGTSPVKKYLIHFFQRCIDRWWCSLISFYTAESLVKKDNKVGKELFW